MSDLSNREVVLKPSVICEPLVNHWHAWPYLIPPATAAMYLANHHLPTMESFVSAPEIHAEALKLAGILGGSFLSHDPTEAPRIRHLLERTRLDEFHLLELAAALRSLEALLSVEAHGGSLEPLYPRVPDILRGFVELHYDLNHRPKFRVIEALLYRSRFYRDGRQGFALSVARDDQRPFVLSTPRLAEPGTLFTPIPFRSEAVDVIARMRGTPAPLGVLRDALGMTSEEPLRPFVEAPAPALGRKPAINGVRVRYFGHACILAEGEGVNVMLDPLVGYRYDGCSPRYGFDDLPERIDYVVITHSHPDHAVLETLLQLRHRIGSIIVPRSNTGSLADPSLKSVLEHVGFRSVHAIEELETIEFRGGSLTALPFLGEHGDLDVFTKAAHLLRIGGKTLVCAADSNNLEPRLYRLVAEMIGKLDVLFLGMECEGAPMSWLYGPLLTRPIPRKDDQSRRLDGSDAARALAIVDELAPKQAYVYAMGAEPWLSFISSIRYHDQSKPIVEARKFVAACLERGIVSEKLFGSKDIRLDS
jgi:L-ascorbate metabolism protein UlaG (beta-lactamase superfamily)